MYVNILTITISKYIVFKLQKYAFNLKSTYVHFFFERRSLFKFEYVSTFLLNITKVLLEYYRSKGNKQLSIQTMNIILKLFNRWHRFRFNLLHYIYANAHYDVLTLSMLIFGAPQYKKSLADQYMH